MHFVYKMDNLFRSIRVSDENSSVTKGFHLFELISTPDFLCVQNAPFKATSSIFNPFWLHLLFFMHLLIFLLSDLEIEKNYKWTLKRLKLGMVSSFHLHSMCKKVERVTAKTGCTSCTKRTISFEVSGFRTKTHLLQRDFIILNLFELQTLCVFKMHHSKPHQQFSTLSDFIGSFSGIHSYSLAKLPWSWKALQMISEKVERWHGIIISPT